MAHINGVKIRSAYVVLSLYVLTVLILLSLIMHLLRVLCTSKKQMNNNQSAINVNYGLKKFMMITICAILSFTIASILEICVILQILLIDVHTLSGMIFVDVHTIEYLKATFDTVGHLCVIFVFICRFEYTFGTFGGGNNYKCVIVTLKSILLVLLLCSAAIILLITVSDHTKTVIICEICWMLSVEITMLYLLYLFTSKLYLLLKMSLTNHMKKMKSGERKSDFYTELTKTMEEKSRNYIDENEEKEPVLVRKESIAVTMVSVMNKMTLLVLLTVLTSTLSVVGNIFIEIHETAQEEKHDVGLESIWASILPLIDNIATCFMLYLQFDFTDNIYRMLLSHLDGLFLNVWLRILKIKPTEILKLKNALSKPKKAKDPKVYFSNERTFLGWFQTAVFIGGSGLTIRSINENDPAGYCLVITALLVLIYAITLYYRRNYKLLKGQTKGLHDMFGPAILVSVMLFVFVYSVWND